MYEAQTPVMKLKRKIYDINNVSIVFSTVTRTSLRNKNVQINTVCMIKKLFRN